MQRLPLRAEGYSLDLDSTVLEPYGRQEGPLKGHKPRKHGRPSHHPLLAVLSEAHFLLHGWRRDLLGMPYLMQSLLAGDCLFGKSLVNLRRQSSEMPGAAQSKSLGTQ